MSSQTLDFFEGDQYRREIFEVKLEKGNFEPAQTFVLKSEFADRFSSEDWDFAEFLKTIKIFLKQNILVLKYSLNMNSAELVHR